MTNLDAWMERMTNEEIHHHGPYVSETCSNVEMNVVRSGHDDQSHLQRIGELTTTEKEMDHVMWCNGGWM